jgi:PhnB protein
MAPSVKPIPDGYHSVTPYLVIKGAAAAIEFYRQVFGATEVLRLAGAAPDQIGHAEIMIGDSHVMLADECPEMEFRGPKSIGGTPVSLMVYVTDVDAVFQRALAGGAKEMQPLTDKFYGDRAGTFEDPFGHVWTVATHVEDVTQEEVERRAAALYAKQGTSS